MKVALYARVSKDEKYNDARYQNPENQLTVLRQYCTHHNYEVVKEYIDYESGANPNRPEFKKLFLEGWQTGFKAVIVWKLDRFSREPLTVVLSYINKLKSAKIGLISVTESWLNIMDDNPISDLVLAVMAWASAEERRKISERTKAGINRLRAIGAWKGGRPKKRGGGVTLEDKPTP